MTMTMTMTVKMSDYNIVYFSAMLIASLTITVVDLNEVAFMSVLIMATVSMDDPNPPKILISRLRAKKYSSGSKYTALQKMFTTV